MIPEIQELPAKIRRILTKANGYLELKMPEDAAELLQNVPAEHRGHPSVLLALSILSMQLGRWAEARHYAKIGSQSFPQMPDFFIIKSQAYGEEGRDWEAKHALLTAPEDFRQTEYYHLTLARLEARLGEFARARYHLAEAMKLNQALASAMNQDPLIGRVE